MSFPYTQEQWQSVRGRVTAEERLMWVIFGGYPPIEELQSRPHDYKKHARSRLKLAGEAGTATETDAEVKLLVDQVNNVLDSLSDAEAEVVRKRFGVDDGHQWTFAQIAEVMNLTEKEVEDLESQALAKLRSPAIIRKLSDYLE